jgi:hypothetical protein
MVAGVIIFGVANAPGDDLLQDGVKTTATVTKYEYTGWNPTIHVRFAANGRTYRSFVRLNDESQLRRGDRIAVRYDRNNPARVTTDDGEGDLMNPSLEAITAFGLIFAIVALLLGIVWVIRARRARHRLRATGMSYP